MFLYILFAIGISHRDKFMYSTIICIYCIPYRHLSPGLSSSTPSDRQDLLKVTSLLTTLFFSGYWENPSGVHSSDPSEMINTAPFWRIKCWSLEPTSTTSSTRIFRPVPAPAFWPVTTGTVGHLGREILLTISRVLFKKKSTQDDSLGTKCCLGMKCHLNLTVQSTLNSSPPKHW